MSLKVNGQTYGWGDVDVKIPGLVLVVQEISYDDEQEMEESYGKGYRPRGYGKGNYKASGKMSMLRDDYDDVLAYCKAKGIPFYGIEWPSVVVSYANEGERTRIDELKKVIPTKRSHKAAQGDGGQMQLFALHLDGNFFTHSANTSRLPRTFPRRQRCMQEIVSLK